MGVRRLAALITGLPPEAVTWRKDGFTPGEEFGLQLLERFDEWQRVHLRWQARKPTQMPPPVRILRPGEQVERPRIETDPRKIAAFFKDAVGAN